MNKEVYVVLCMDSLEEHDVGTFICGIYENEYDAEELKLKIYSEMCKHYNCSSMTNPVYIMKMNMNCSYSISFDRDISCSNAYNFKGDIDELNWI